MSENIDNLEVNEQKESTEKLITKPSLKDRYCNKRFYNLLVLSIGFMILFSAFNTTQVLKRILN